SVFDEDSWGFSIQQASEKALKASLLLLFPAPPPFTRNLRLLFPMLRDQGADIEPTSNGPGVDAIDMASGDGCAGGGREGLLRRGRCRRRRRRAGTCRIQSRTRKA
ncbi:MAG: hypothetical protein VKO44_10105, partial [Cyanobacteriota bacterium]|nr:hypothetical protein [Cyanobacteriota bacterium]